MTMLYTYTQEDLTTALNQGKDILIFSLLKEKVITKEQAENINKNYSLVVNKPSTFGELFKKLLGNGDSKEQPCIVLTKVIHLKENE